MYFVKFCKNDLVSKSDFSFCLKREPLLSLILIDNSFLKTRLPNYNEVYFCEIMLLEKINLQMIEEDGYNITN